MPRVKSIAQRKHREIRKATKGFRNARRRRVKSGKEAIMHAGQYAYEGRKNRKRVLRGLWIIRLNAAARLHDFSYSKFIASLKKANVEIDRKILSDIAVSDPETFSEIVNKVK